MKLCLSLTIGKEEGIKMNETTEVQKTEEVEVVEVAKNLATIQKIASLTPIEGADKIELVKMEGLEWQVVSQKGNKVGDLVCYIQIDSVCPEKPWAEFLRDRHFRVRTIRLKKQLSQGLIIPLKDVIQVFIGSNGYILGENETPLVVGADITTAIGVTKYEKPIPANLHGHIKGNFPSKYVSVTDEERLQNCSRILEELSGVKGYVSVKMDGTSATFINFLPDGLTEGEQHVCSRRLSLKAPSEGDKPNVYFEMEKKYNILEKLKAKGNYAVQGEICGPGIQGNRAGLKELDFFVFNVYSISEKRYLNFDEFIAFTTELGLTTVPIADADFDFTGKRFDDLLAMADGTYPNGLPREGIVFRPLVEKYSDYMKGRVSFKVVSNKFLEHYKE
jgi:RNA ligase (TIGR02306 family)